MKEAENAQVRVPMGESVGSRARFPSKLSDGKAAKASKADPNECSGLAKSCVARTP